MKPHERIRNFSIIAHIDHGKSTLADRILEKTRALSEREMMDQVLDDMDLERERGITIKARAVRLFYDAQDGRSYQLNLIDTPGHVDFSYEVSRSLAACEGALLVVDAAQGVEAQTLANAYLAVNGNLTLVPVINKIDLPAADPDRVKEQIENVVGIDAHDAVLTSAKAGIGIEDVLERVVRDVPPPKGDPEAPLKALLFDSWYDPYRGVACMIRVMDGTLRQGEKIRFMSSGRTYGIDELGVFNPKPSEVEQLSVGEVGFLYAGIKDLIQAQIGDTVTHADRPASEAWPGFQEIKPMVFAGLYPVSADDYEGLRDAVDKLRLNDASFTFEPESSGALGFGFRCGFLGLLHMDIIQERLEREGHVEVVQTAPTVSYEILIRGDKPDLHREGGGQKSIEVVRIENGNAVLEVHNPADLPNPSNIMEIREPICRVDIMLPKKDIGAIMKLCLDRRGVYKSQTFVSDARDMLCFELPLAEIIYDFYDKLKGMTAGYGTMDYELIGFKNDDLVKMDILVNGDPVEALSVIVHRAKAELRGRALIARLKEQIPKHQFEIPLQAAIGARVIARETIK
ncbi:MAG TPA: translation elongation factor 4, partial [Thermoanaerobaculia bacterium]|nr:translation elongation factor 4 [Thermoanaerobaculia bacterium]